MTEKPTITYKCSERHGITEPLKPIDYYGWYNLHGITDIKNQWIDKYSAMITISQTRKNTKIILDFFLSSNCLIGASFFQMET